MSDQLTDGPAAQVGPSPAQVAANRSNASRSTGPRTAAGKSRSSRNAVKHGMYSRSSLAITEGPFAEDEDQVEAFLDEMIDDLDPRDSVEAAQAHRIAQLHLQEHRMDRWEAAGLNATARGTRLTQLLVAHNYEYALIDHIAYWNAARRRDADAGDVMEPNGGTDERPRELMAEWLRELSAPGLTLDNLWDESNTPKTPEQWRRAFEVLAEYVFPEPPALGAWLMRRNALMAAREEEVGAQERANAAALCMDLMPGVLAQRTRVTRDLGHRLAMYNMMRSRPSVPREASHISETNPNCGLDSADGPGAMTRRHQVQNRSET